jgi:hypothetical protein
LTFFEEFLKKVDLKFLFLDKNLLKGTAKTMPSRKHILKN